jgi:hypothetical protein
MASTYVHWTPGSTFTGDKFTYSGWFKRGDLSARNCMLWASSDGGTADYTEMEFQASGAIHWANKPNGGTAGNLITNRLFRDPAAWYHLVFAWDTTASAGDRMRIYVNGVEETSFATDSNPGSAETGCSLATSGVEVDIGKQHASTYFFNGEMSHLNLTMGTAYAASDFGETDSTSGIWTINETPSVTHGTNGWQLNMEDRTNLDLDTSANAYSFTTSGTLTATYDNPDNNFATMNPIYYWSTGTTYSNGNTSLITSTANKGRPATMGVQAGKWYWEVQCNVNANGCTGIVSETAVTGADLDDSTVASGFDGYAGNRAIGYEFAAGDLMDVSSTSSAWGATIADGDVVQVALDLDNNKLYFGKNGTWQNSGDPTSGATGTGAVSITAHATLPALGDIWWFPLWHSFDTLCKGEFNFGNGYFGTTAVTSAQADDAGIGAMEYDVPAGYYCLCTKNIKAYGG